MSWTVGTRIGPLHTCRRIRPGHGLIGALTGFIWMYVTIVLVAWWCVRAMLIIMYLSTKWTAQQLGKVSDQRNSRQAKTWSQAADTVEGRHRAG